jgi:NAD(P)-dependent dehydrogenase (short-subunit alcohol dehydrogenase family)
MIGYIPLYFIKLIHFIYSYIHNYFYGKVKKHKNEKKEKVNRNPVVKMDLIQKIYNHGRDIGYNNVITRHFQNSHVDLYEFDKMIPLSTKSIKLNNNHINCYGCNNKIKSVHPVYLYSCVDCGTFFQKNRHLTRNLSGHISLVIGCRTKLGHQVMMKLLRAGSIVIGTSRFDKVVDMIRMYPDSSEWINNFYFYKLDMDTTTQNEDFKNLAEYISSKFGHLDNYIHCAAQTIKVRETGINKPNGEFNRYMDPKFVEKGLENSWSMRIEDMTQHETEQVLRINACAPLILTRYLVPVLTESPRQPYIIFVHAREGLFNVYKSKFHIHTNMAKASLAMLTRCLKECKYKTSAPNSKSFSIHGCDPGWISIDEYYEEKKPWICPPLDEVDGAARILYPLFKDIKGSFTQTRRHFKMLTI